MDPNQELNHLRSGSWPEAPPEGEFDRLAVTPEGQPAAVLERCQEVLGLLLEHSAGEWPGLEDWREILPGWFTEACLDDALVQNCILDKWSLRGWLHWLRPENRRWFWWSAELEGSLLKVTVLVPERPYLRGALDWLLKTAGARELEKV